MVKLSSRWQGKQSSIHASAVLCVGKMHPHTGMYSCFYETDPGAGKQAMNESYIRTYFTEIQERMS